MFICLQATIPETHAFDDVEAYWREGRLGHSSQDQQQEEGGATPNPTDDEDSSTESAWSFSCGVSSGEEEEEGDSEDSSSEFPSWTPASPASLVVSSTSPSSLPCSDCGLHSQAEVDELVDNSTGEGVSSASSGTPPHDEVCHPEAPCASCEAQYAQEATAYMEAVVKPDYLKKIWE